MNILSGNLQGLGPADRKLLERLARRRIDPHVVMPPELAQLLCEASRTIGRQVGLIVDRKGDVQHVVVGDMHKLFLPDLGPRRGGGIGRLRGVRLLHTHLRSEPLSHDDLMDLAKLRLDLVAVIVMSVSGQPGPLSVAHLLPPNPEQQMWRVLDPIPAHHLYRDSDLDPIELVRSIEDETAATLAKVREVGGGGERAVVVHVQIGRMTDDESQARRYELLELCRTAGVRALDQVTQRRAQVDPKYLIGKGKLEEIMLKALQVDASLLVFDQDLTPAQARTIGDAVDLKVIDRTMLILDIFAQHAQSRDGKLQVELAQLKYTLPRLHEKSTMMSRLTGGIGGRGPGETKLEIDRRRARERVHLLETQIEQLGKRREQRRSLRKSSSIPIVAIVGYTNAGTSTLIDALTNAEALAENKLFATLDPTSRRLRFPSEREIVLTDTVGFIRDLPKDLVAAFRATLEELGEADLLLHVVDASDPAHERQIEAVEQILEELELSGKARVLVYNKCDRLDEDGRRLLDAEIERAGTTALGVNAVAISAVEHATLEPLTRLIERRLWAQDRLIDAEEAATGGELDEEASPSEGSP